MLHEIVLLQINAQTAQKLENKSFNSYRAKIQVNQDMKKKRKFKTNFYNI